MKTPTDIQKVAMAQLKAQFTTDGISALVGLVVKPLNAGDQYVAINTLPTGNAKLQSGIINVNVHAKDTLSGTNYYPNMKDIDALTKSAIAAFDNSSRDGYYFFIDRIGLEEDEAVHEHYNNIRVKYNTIN